MLTFLVLVAIVAASLMLLAHFLGREERNLFPPAASAETPVSSEQVGLGDPEWKVVMRGQCQPIHCPNLRGNPPRPGKEPGCQVCASLFLERYGERLLKQQREGRNR